VTYYTIPFKQDGSCCETCGPPSNPCSCEECQWYCVMAQLCTSGDCTAGCETAVEMCLCLTPAEVAAIPVCVGPDIPGGPGGGFYGSIHVLSIVSGPHADSLGCLSVCPPWYCVKYTGYENADCTGAVVGVSYACEQLLTTQLPPPGGICLGNSLLMELVSGPYDNEADCVAVCGVCCSFDTVYAGKSVTFSGSFEYRGPGPGGSSSLYTFTGSYVAGGVFSGTLSWSTDFCDRDDPTSCFDGLSNCTNVPGSDPDSTLTVTCAVEGGNIVYSIVVADSFGPVFQSYPYWTFSQLANCGNPVGCSSSQVIVCSTTYDSSCFSVSGGDNFCTESYFDEACTPPAYEATSQVTSFTASIA